jgi:hypothetical protein
MTKAYVVFSYLLFSSCLLFFSPAEAATPTLTARETGVALYARQDAETDRIATLEKGEPLFPMAEGR